MWGAAAGVGNCWAVEPASSWCWCTVRIGALAGAWGRADSSMGMTVGRTGW